MALSCTLMFSCKVDLEPRPQNVSYYQSNIILETNCDLHLKEDLFAYRLKCINLLGGKMVKGNLNPHLFSKNVTL